MAILFREEARVFSLLDVETEVAALANDDITLVGMRDQGRRRAYRTLLSKDLLSARSSARVLNTRVVFLLLTATFKRSIMFNETYADIFPCFLMAS